MNPRVTIIGGPNGAGKSTLAPLLLRDWLGLMEFVNADAIASGLSAFRPEQAALEAGRVMLRRLRELAARRENFAFETTLATRSYAPWVRRLRQEGWSLNLVFVWLENSELALARVSARVAAGGHHIPEETVRRRYRKGIENFFALYQPLAESWRVFDNSAASMPMLIARGKETAVEAVFHDDLWKRFCEAAQ